MKVHITNNETGEMLTLEGVLYVASNGVMFVKSGNKTVWASGSTTFTVEVK